MAADNKLQSYLIGEDNFTLACAEVLLKHHFTIIAICTRNPALTEWANKNDINVYRTYESFERKLLKATAGFLFSILNNQILPEKIVNKENFHCINYHNALLPHYAGTHATSWAILNGETQHGVTWHTMSTEIDAGDILKQDTIDIDKSETAISLDLKCTECGLKLFEELITEQFDKGWKAQKQNLAARTYFPKSMKPEGNALINWASSAKKIERLGRACNYAYTSNDFSLPKINFGKNLGFILAKQFTLSPGILVGEPGEIIKISDQSLEIATSTNNIIVSGFMDPDGTELSVSELRHRFSLYVGKRLPISKENSLKLFQKTNAYYAKQENAWVSNFLEAKIPNVPKLPVSKARRPNSYKKTCDFKIDYAITKKLKYLNSIPNNQVALALVLFYLQRINNYEDFSIGLTIPDLIAPSEFQHFFLNFSWFKCNFSPEQSFENFLKDINLELSKEEYKLNCLKDILARYPALQNHYVLPNIVIDLSDSDPSFIETTLLIKIEESGISLYLNDTEEEIESDQYYLIESMGQKIQVILDALNKNINTPIYTLPLLNDSGLSLYVEAFPTPTEVTLPLQSLISLFENQASKNPDQIAVVYKDINISYAELNSQANHLALKLRKKHIKPGDYIGVTSLSGVETIIALIAILKLGAIYVPIDPLYPDRYLGYLLNDLHPKLILSRSFFSQGFESFLTKFYPDTLFYSFSYLPGSTFANNLNLKHNNKIAYVMYTSGSTGRPKGVVISEFGITRLVINNNFLTFKPKHKVAQASNLSFDASTLEIWGALLNGSTLVCIDKETLLDPIKLKKSIMENHIDIMWVTSSLFDQHVENDPLIFSGIKYLLVGGDVVNAKTVKKVLQTENNRIKLVINGYGPTENTTFSTTYAIKPNEKIPENIPIGRPIAHTRTYVVDKYLQPVCIGIPGELLLSGVGLAHQYISCEAKDKESFIETSSLNGKMQRYYKTGEYVKWLCDGNLSYLGRKDSQIKVRGFRIEISTIKNILLRHEKISRCHIEINNNQLRAYIIPKRKLTLSKAELSNYFSENLPYYMIPTEIFFLDHFPLTSNGKLDTISIQSLKHSSDKKQIRGPRNKTEQKLVDIWQSILMEELISIDDNFFEIGGNSLTVSALISRIYQEFNFRLLLSEFLNEPTITSLADSIKGKTKKSKLIDRLLADVDIDFSNAVHYSAPSTRPSTKTILVTGATGFLGSHLVHELAKSKNKIICFVRANNHNLAVQKLKNSFKQWSLPETLLQSTSVIFGDLSNPELGLDKQNFDQLTGEISEVYHTAADVNHVYGYNQLRGSNVRATENILNLAHINNDIQINYVSTLSACFSHLDSHGCILESFIEEQSTHQNINDGYSLTKWVGERLISKMHKKGFKLKIFRPAWITGDSKNGNMPLETNHLLLLVKACIQLGYAPNWDARINMTPVDELAKAMIIGSTHSEAVFNAVNNQTISWLNTINLARSLGHKVEIISAQQWYDLISHIDKSNALFPLLSIYTDTHNQDWILKQDIISNAHNDNYRQLLDRMEYRTLVNKLLLAKYLTHANQLLYSGSLISHRA